MSILYGDIHWCDFPVRGGCEQSGRRPGLIWTDNSFLHLPSILLIPLTSKLTSLRFDGTMLLQPSTQNGPICPSVVLVFQLGSFDRNRIDARIGRLDDPDLAKIADMARQLQRL